jgi:hypothetical protein
MTPCEATCFGENVDVECLEFQTPYVGKCLFVDAPEISDDIPHLMYLLRN